MLKNKKVKVSVLVLLTVIGLGMAVFFIYQNFFKDESNQSTDQDINYTEPTVTEQSETDQNKERVIAETEAQNNQTTPTTSQSSGKKSVTPVISYIGQATPGSEVQANGYVPGIIEKDGSCTLTLSRGSSIVKDSRSSIDNVQDTSCGLFTVPKAKLSNGTWTATLTYTSAKSSGTSEKVTVEVK